MFWAVVCLSVLAAANAQLCNQADEISAPYSDIDVSGPNGAVIESNLKAGLKSGTMVQNAGGVNEIDYSFDPPTQLVRVKLRSKLAYEIVVEFYDAADNLLDTQTTNPPPTTNSQDSVAIPAGGALNGVARVHLSFKSQGGEWAINPVEFFRCRC